MLQINQACFYCIIIYVFIGFITHNIYTYTENVWTCLLSLMIIVYYFNCLEVYGDKEMIFGEDNKLKQIIVMITAKMLMIKIEKKMMEI